MLTVHAKMDLKLGRNKRERERERRWLLYWGNIATLLPLDNRWPPTLEWPIQAVVFWHNTDTPARLPPDCFSQRYVKYVRGKNIKKGEEGISGPEKGVVNKFKVRIRRGEVILIGIPTSYMPDIELVQPSIAHLVLGLIYIWVRYLFVMVTFA